jgi:hypothetical protein
VQHLTFAVVYGKKEETTHVFELWGATMTKKYPQFNQHDLR